MSHHKREIIGPSLVTHRPEGNRHTLGTELIQSICVLYHTSVLKCEIRQKLGKERKFCSCCTWLKSREGAVTRHYFQRLVPGGHFPQNMRALSLDYISSPHMVVFQPTRIQIENKVCYSSLWCCLFCFSFLLTKI